MMAEHVERWGAAHELSAQSSLVLLDHVCEACGRPFVAGQWARSRYGPRGGSNFHDDCTTAQTDDEETVDSKRG